MMPLLYGTILPHLVAVGLLHLRLGAWNPTSSELTVPKEEAAAYRQAKDELGRYDAMISDSRLTASDKERLTGQRQALRDLIDKVFGKEDGLSSTEFEETMEYLHEHSN